MRGAKRYQDLIVWQLADQIRVLVFMLTGRQSFARDLKLHSQTEDAANSVCRNIAEGFACKHKEFARFLEISRRSLTELDDSFRAAQLKRYVTAHEYEPIWRLTHRLYPAFARLIRYLQTTPDPQFSNATRSPSHRPGATSHRRRVTSHRPGATSHRPTPPRTDRRHLAPTTSHIAPTDATSHRPDATSHRPKPPRTDPTPPRTDREPPRTDDESPRTDPKPPRTRR